MDVGGWGGEKWGALASKRFRTATTNSVTPRWGGGKEGGAGVEGI